MSKRLCGLLLLAMWFSTEAWALSRKIVKSDFGMCAESNEFFGYIDSDQSSRPVSELNGWVDEVGVGALRVNIPPFYGTAYDSNKTWWDACWANTASYAQSKGIKITFLFGSCWWASGTNKTAYLDALKAKVGSSAVKGKIAFYELGNELDLPIRDQGITVAQYKEWLIDVSAAIRQADPAAKLIMASCAGVVRNNEAYGWMKDMLAAGCGSHVDYYSIHTYYHNPNSNPADDSLKTLANMVNTWVTQTGAPKKPLLFTEGGFSLSGPYAMPGADSGYQQRWNTQRILRLWAKDIPYPVERIDTFILKDYANEPYGFGLLTGTKAKRWQYYGIKNVYSLLKDSIFFNERNAGSGSKCYEFMKADGQKVAVVWAKDWTSRPPVSIRTGSASAEILTHNGAGNPISTPTTATSVSISYDLEQKYLKTGGALYWMEGELPSSANYTVSSANHGDCYNGKHSNLFTAATGNRDVYYTFNLADAGTYRVYIAATPANASWASKYKYILTAGTKNLGNPYTGVWKSSTDGAVVKETGVAYGTSDALRWTDLGTFTLSSGAATFVLRVDNAVASSGKYTHYLDAVYLERQ